MVGADGMLRIAGAEGVERTIGAEGAERICGAGDDGRMAGEETRGAEVAPTEGSGPAERMPSEGVRTVGDGERYSGSGADVVARLFGKSRTTGAFPVLGAP